MNRWKKRSGRMLALLIAAVLLGSGTDYAVQTVWAKDGRTKAKKSGAKETIEVTVPDLEDSFMDNDEMFAGYVQKLLYQDISEDIELYGNVGGSRLTGVNKSIYNELKTKIEAVAAGEAASTEFKFSKTIKLTTQDIGGVFSEESVGEAFEEKVDRKGILSYLLMDCPYDLYWFDKTDGMICRYTVTGSDESGAELSDIIFSFTVAKEYRAGNKKYEVDTSNIDLIKDAAETAKGIVEKYADSSDFGKLDGYRKEICDLVNYNSTANDEADTTDYGNPWQLIWVFDGDAGTDVVCEGYAKAFQYLCDLTEFSNEKIACYTVSGIMDGGTGEGPHMWNVVTMEDEKNYLVDITNCDSGAVGAPNKLFLAGASAGGVVEGYSFDIGGAKPVAYKYDSDPDQNRLLGDGVLTLARSKYVKKETPKITMTDRTVEVVFADSPEKFDFFTNGIRSENKEGYSIAGTFSWEENVLSSGYGAAGQHTYQVIFTPEDTKTYLSASASVRVVVKPRQIEPALTIDPESYTYTGEQIVPTFSLKYGELEIDPSEYTVKYSDNINTGTCTMTVVQKEAGNLEWKDVTGTFQIGKADFAGERSQEVSVKYGTSDEYDIAAMLPPDYKTGELNITDNRGIFAETPTLDDTILKYTAVEDEKKIGRKATVKIPVTAKNYNDFEIQLTITVRAKLNQSDFRFAEETAEKTYGDPDFTITASGAEKDSEVTYSSSDEGIASVDNKGLVHILRSGSTVITAYASETEEYLEETASYTLTVKQKALEWDTDQLCAVDKEGKIPEDNSASLYGELKVKGLVNAEDAAFDCPAGKLKGVYEKTDPGTQKVRLSWSEGPVTLQGEKADCYILPDTLPELSGKINFVSEMLQEPPEAERNVKYKLEIESGISTVPALFADKENLNTPAKIEQQLKQSIQEKNKDISEKNMAVYDIVLMLDDGNGWKEATVDNFPESGLTLTLPYPEDTEETAQAFTVCHLFTQDMNGYVAGDAEYPEVKKDGEGIHFTVHGLSPIAAGWMVIDEERQEASRELASGNSSGNTGEGSSSGNGSKGVKTGDYSQWALYAVLLALSFMGIGRILIYRHRERNRQP